VRAVIVYDGQFEIAIEGGVRYRLPFHGKPAKRRLFDLSLIQIKMAQESARFAIPPDRGLDALMEPL
jgi:hypothetical protein